MQLLSSKVLSMASPGPIGATNPNTGSFTTLTASGNISTSGTYTTTGGNVTINAPTGNSVLSQVNGSTITQTSSTGLGVTGDVTPSGRLVLQTSSTVGAAGQIGYNSLNGTYIYANTGTNSDFVLYSPAGTAALTLNGVNITLGGTLSVTGGVDKLRTASGVVSVSAATAPSSGQVLTATSATTATWQTPTGGAVESLSPFLLMGA